MPLFNQGSPVFSLTVRKNQIAFWSIPLLVLRMFHCMYIHYALYKGYYLMGDRTDYHF